MYSLDMRNRHGNSMHVLSATVRIVSVMVGSQCPEDSPLHTPGIL